MNGQPANPWHDATVEPTDWPILTINRSGNLGIVDRSWNKPWACVVEGEGIVEWKTIELPVSVVDKDVKGPGRPVRPLETQRFGRLTVLRRSDYQPRRHACWICRCDCGGIARVTGNELLRGLTRSCGCLRRGSRPRGGSADAKGV